MKSLLSKLVRFAKQVRGLFPSPLPTGTASFGRWVEDIKETYSLPTQDKDSICFCFSTIIMRFDPTTANKSKYYFVRALRAAAAKQIAGDAFQDIKLRQKAEATAALAVANAKPTQ